MKDIDSYRVSSDPEWVRHLTTFLFDAEDTSGEYAAAHGFIRRALIDVYLGYRSRGQEEKYTNAYLGELFLEAFDAQKISGRTRIEDLGFIPAIRTQGFDYALAIHLGVKAGKTRQQVLNDLSKSDHKTVESIDKAAARYKERLAEFLDLYQQLIDAGLDAELFDFYKRLRTKT